MQNLKVYLSSKPNKQKASIQKLKLNIKHKVPQLQVNFDKQKLHHHSQNNLLLSKSTDSRNNINIQSQAFTNNNKLVQLHPTHQQQHHNHKKKNLSNLHTVNRSLQQLYDFRQEVRNIIYHKEPNRYGKDAKEPKEQKEPKESKLDRDGKRKSSKQVVSDTKLYYRSQPHHQLTKIGNKQNKNDKSLQQIVSKKRQEGYMMYDRPELKIKSFEDHKSKGIEQQKNSKGKVVVNQKQPAKKRSKSANPQKRPSIQKKQAKKQKRSYSLKKVQKNHNNSTSIHAQVSEKQTINLLREQISMKCMYRTRKGVQIMNPNKVNQDRLYIKENVHMSNQQNMSIFAVADGHGPFGHHVSHLIVDNLYKRFDNNLKNNRTIQVSLQRTFAQIQSLLIKNIQFNADFSGSTLVTLVVDSNRNAVCANVGDSRAIVARQLNKTSWEVIRLSNDHKPSLQEQKSRILSLGGRIDTVYDEDGKGIGPLRVWLPKKQMQGLAMSRSLGDNISKPIGVTHEPELLSHQLTKDDKFILLASDGVWQFLTNYQILSLIIPYYRQNRLEDACEALMKQAHKSWTVQDNSVVDDITFILIFLTADGSIEKGEAVTMSKQQKLIKKSKINTPKVSSKQQVFEDEQIAEDSLDSVQVQNQKQQKKEGN